MKILSKKNLLLNIIFNILIYSLILKNKKKEILFLYFQIILKIIINLKKIFYINLFKYFIFYYLIYFLILNET